MNKTLSFFIFSFFVLNSISIMQAESISGKTSNYASFCQLAADYDEIFKEFKSHPVYRQFLEQLHYEGGLLCLDFIKKEYPELTNFEPYKQNDILGSPLKFNYKEEGYFSPTTLRYLKIACDLKKQFGNLNDWHMVEIGGGYGGQCKIISELTGFASYTIIDLPQSNALAKKYLNKLGVKNVHFIDCDNLSEVGSYDLVISNYSFSEIDKVEQKKYFEKIIEKTPNGYMVMNFISHYFGLESLSIEEFIRLLYQNSYQGKVETEQPITHPNNLLVTWQKNKPNIIHSVPQAKLDDSLENQTSNAITYSFSGGRLGDNLIAYFHAKWLSCKYGLPFLYQPFPYSDQFCLDKKDQLLNEKLKFKKNIFLLKEEDIQTVDDSTLFVSPYFPETRSEYEWCNLYWLPFFTVDWEDPIFHQEVVECLQTKQPISPLHLPSNCITLAVHIRRGYEGGLSNYRMQWPLKFVDDDYYIEQIRRIAAIFNEKKLYVHIFTDDDFPEVIINKYKQVLNNPRITFNYQREKEILADFVAMQQFDCCILCQSNFSIVASKLGKYAISISPVHTVLENNQPKIDKIELVFGRKQLDLDYFQNGKTTH